MGKIQNSNLNTVGWVESNGKIQDSNLNTVGWIESNGKVQDSNLNTVGWGDPSDGIVFIGGAALVLLLRKSRY